jgi:CheY-like chemotaxis protein
MGQAVERGASLTRQLLAFGRQKALNPEPVDLGQRVRGMREMLARSLRGDIQVELAIAPGTWIVEVDPLELELVVLNLCVNARDAMPEGGAITVSVGPEGDDRVRLAVADSGVGMTPEVVARAFEPFFTTKDVGQGSGLGLPQVYGFAKQSGGEVVIASERGRGTNVTITLPRSSRAVRPAADAGDAATTPVPGGPASGHVLLVEDDAQVAALTGELLRSLGYEVQRAASAAAALEILADGAPVDLVLSDIMMPGGTSGLELARQFRARRPGIPVLLATGYPDAAGGARAEGFEVLLKPYRSDLLAARLRGLIPGAPAG